MCHKKMKRTAYFIFTLLALSVPAMAQEAPSAVIGRALDLYRSGQYAVARNVLASASESMEGSGALLMAQAAACDALCAIALDDPAARRTVTSFLETYPFSPDAGSVRFAYASSLFNKGLYEDAIPYYVAIADSYIADSDVDRYLFEKAYCRMETGVWDKAAESFSRIVKRPYSKFTTAAHYYLGYIQYRESDFKHAMENFTLAARDPKFETVAGYYMVESEYMLSDYDYVVKYGPTLYPALEDDFKTRLAKVISEAFYAKDDIVNAKLYFDRYRTTVNEFTRKDHYLEGIISVYIKDYESAAESFSKAVGTDSLGQNAWYQLSGAYLLMKNKKSALEAFRKASDLDFNLQIKEDAYFNYAKLAFDLNGDMAPFDNYLTLFPSTEKGDEINNYIATACILSKDYQGAIDALRKIRHPNDRTRANLQRASYFRAMEYITMRSYSNASAYLDIALDNAEDKRLQDLSCYWLGECRYRAGDYRAAAALFTKLYNDRTLRDADFYNMLQYNLGYVYLKDKDYPSSAYCFERFIKDGSSPKEFISDACVRLGDARFMLKEYQKACDAYSESGNSAYAMFQAAVACGLNGDNQKKLDMLSRIGRSASTDTGTRSRALFETGRTYAQIGDDLKAESCFNDLLQLTDDNNMASRALLELGLIRANKGDFEGALEKYRTIVEKYSATTSFEDALSSMESIYQSSGRADEYLEFLDRRGLSSVKTEDQKERMLFESAEQKYLSGNTGNAVSALQSFLKLYPDSPLAAQAHYYLAESLLASNRKEAAAEQFYQVMLADNEQLNEPATYRYAEVCYALALYEKAAEAYETLSYIATTPQNHTTAAVGKMRSYYNAKQYQRARSSAEKVLDSDDQQYRREALYICGKSNQALSNTASAMECFTLLSTDRNDAMGAEAAYILIKDEYDAGHFDNVEQMVYSFSDSGSVQSYWLAKSFIILGDSFADRKNYDQAFATFQSIKEGYVPSGDRDDVPEQVDLRLETIHKLVD